MSCEFKIVKTGTFRDEKFAALTPHARLTFFAVLCNTNHLGAWRYSVEQLIEETGLTSRNVQDTLSELCDAGILVADRKSKLLWFPRYFHHNPIGSWKRAKGLVREFGVIPECPLRMTIAASVVIGLGDNDRAVDEFSDAFCKAYRLLPTGLNAAVDKLADTLSESCDLVPDPAPDSLKDKTKRSTSSGAALSSDQAACLDGWIDRWNSTGLRPQVEMRRRRHLVASFLKAWNDDERRDHLDAPDPIFAVLSAAVPLYNSRRWFTLPHLFSRNDDEEGSWFDKILDGRFEPFENEVNFHTTSQKKPRGLPPS